MKQHWNEPRQVSVLSSGWLVGDGVVALFCVQVELNLVEGFEASKDPSPVHSYPADRRKPMQHAHCTVNLAA